MKGTETINIQLIVNTVSLYKKTASSEVFVEFVNKTQKEYK